MSVRERIDALLEPLRSEERTLSKQRDELQDELGKVEAELQELQEVLSSFVPPKRVANGRGVVRKKKKKFKATSPETNARVLQTMMSEPTRAWTGRELTQQTGLHSTSVANALRVLVAEHRVENLGRLPRPENYTGLTPYGYRIPQETT